MSKSRTHNQPEQLLQRKKLRHKSTPEENALWKILKGKQLGGTKWRRQFSIGPYILDFYSTAAKLCVEVDGIQHKREDAIKHDTTRDRYLAQQNIKVIRVPNDIVWTQSDYIATTILQEVETRIKQF